MGFITRVSMDTSHKSVTMNITSLDVKEVLRFSICAACRASNQFLSNKEFETLNKAAAH